MKKLLFLPTLLLIVLVAFGQTPTPSKDYYLKKSRTQKTIGWIMLGGGIAMTTTGYAVKNKQVNNDPLDAITTGQGYVLLTIAGAAAALGSIPFLIASAKNKRKAATISFTNQKIVFPQLNAFVLKRQATLVLKIPL